MSVDTKLYIESKWELNDVKEILESHFDLVEKRRSEKVFNKRVVRKFKVEIEPSKGQPNCYNMYFEIKGSKQGPRRMFVITNTHSPIGPATWFSLGHNEESIQIMRKIADVLGGAVIENDCECDVDFVDGSLHDGDGLAYFIKYALIHNEMKNNDDLAGLIHSIHNWEERIAKHQSSSSGERIIKGEFLQWIKEGKI